MISLRDGTRPILAIVVEVQPGTDPGKHLTWPVYPALVRHRLHCPAMLVIFCRTERMAAWCRRPIDMGHPGRVPHPLVIGPGQVPVVTDAGTVAATPALGVLSALAHGEGACGLQVAQALLEGRYRAGQGRDEATRDLYARCMDAVLAEPPDLVRKHLEMQTATTMEHRSAFARCYFAEGEAEGEARGEAEGRAEGELEGTAGAIVEVLTARGLQVPEEVAARIRACQDLATLHRRLRRAATTATIEDLLD